MSIYEQYNHHFKVQKGTKDIVKTVDVTSVAQT